VILEGSMKYLIYSVEDDDNIRELLQFSLSNFGFDVKTYGNAEDMLLAIQEELPHLIILDLMLPKQSGSETLVFLRKNPKTMDIPIILLTANNNEMSKVTNLNLGADDYMVKPFSVLELIARINASLRRYSIKDHVSLISIEDVIMNTESRTVIKSGVEIKLTLKEYELLKKLMLNVGKVVEREEILQEIWGYDYLGETRTLDMHIKSIRKKLGDEGTNPKYINTIRGIGFQFLRGKYEE
jgi:two-component system, OmpR family, alkaline phosphatase synthesis response regulator PhoP